MTDNDRLSQANRVLLLGLGLNIVLIVLKFWGGVVGHSKAVIADAVHSLSDLTTDVAVLWGVRAAAKPADEDHSYGHGKIETLFSALIGLFLFSIGVGIIYNGVVAAAGVFAGETIPRPGLLAVVVAAISAVTKEWIYRKTRCVGKATQNSALIANAWHHRSDALSSAGVVIGVTCAMLLGEAWRILDPLAAVIVGIFILKAAYDIVASSLHDLTEGSLEQDVEEEIIRMVSSVEGVFDPHGLKTRKVGSAVAIDIHIRVHNHLNVGDAHVIATKVEDTLKQRFGSEIFISVHIEPLIK